MPQYLVTLPDDPAITDLNQEAEELQEYIQEDFCGDATVKLMTEDQGDTNANHPDSRP